MENKNSPVVDMCDLLSSYSKQLGEAIALAQEQEIFNLLIEGDGLQYPPSPTYKTYKMTYKLDLEKIDQELQQLEKFIFPSNNYSIPLRAEEIFVGKIEDVSQYDAVFLCVFSDVPSKRGACCIQWSSDGNIWVATDPFGITPGITTSLSLPVKNKYVRVYFQNGNKNQTTFYVRLEGRINTLTPATCTNVSGQTICKTLPIDELGGKRKYNFEEE